MKIEYYPDVDMLYLGYSDKPSVRQVEIKPDFVEEYDAEGNKIGLEVEHASKYFKIEIFEVDSSPVISVSKLEGIAA